jgi:ABC-2 type transport system permease protein
MNWPMVQRLVLKDWYFFRWAIGVYLAAGALSIAMMSLASSATFYFGSILLITIVITAGIHVTMLTVVQERSEHTLAFVMTLPISPREYTMAKILANLTIFAAPWLALTAGTIVILAAGTAPMRAIIPFAVLVLVELMASYCLMLTVAIVSESQGWTIAAMVTGNLFLQVFLYYVSRVPSIAQGMKSSSGPVWDSASVLLLSVEVAAIVLMMVLTFVLQGRKRDFL